MEIEKRPILIIDSEIVRYRSFSIVPATPAFRSFWQTERASRVTHFEIEITRLDETELHLVRHEFEGSVRPRTGRRVLSFS